MTRLLVCGDLILDRYVWGRVERISPEAPVPVLLEDRVEERAGGAAAVAVMAKALGADVELVGVTGCDTDGKLLRELLDIAIVSHRMVKQIPDWTTLKERFLDEAGRQVGLRHDRETPKEWLADLSFNVHYDAILVADYSKGVVSAKVFQAVAQHAKRCGVPLIVDPARGRDWRRYIGATHIKANRIEAAEEWEGSYGKRRPEGASEWLMACQELGRFYGCEVIITADGDGLYCNGQHFPAEKRHCYDPCGAGDQVLATLGVALATGSTLQEAARLANAAGGLQVERVGVSPITAAELEAAYGQKVDLEQADVQSKV